jgi:hypothetical protein
MLTGKIIFHTRRAVPQEMYGRVTCALEWVSTVNVWSKWIDLWAALNLRACANKRVSTSSHPLGRIDIEVARHRPRILASQFLQIRRIPLITVASISNMESVEANIKGISDPILLSSIKSSGLVEKIATTNSVNTLE